MKPADDIKTYFKKATLSTHPGRHEDVFALVRQAQGEIQPVRSRLWRQLMTNKKIRFSVAACIILAMGLGVLFWQETGNEVWALEESLDALENLQQAELHVDFEGFGAFEFQFKRSLDDPAEPLLYAKQSSGRFSILKGNHCYMGYENCPELYSIPLQACLDGPAMLIYYQVYKQLPQLLKEASTALQAAQLLSEQWTETYAKDPQTKRDIVIVTGLYSPLNTSFEIVFDVQTKLPLRGQYWLNPQRDGKPYINVTSVNYDVRIPDTILDVEAFTGAKVVSFEGYKERGRVFRQICEEQDDTKIIEDGLEFYQRYPHYCKTAEVLSKVGCAYGRLKEYDQAIAIFQQILTQYSYPYYAASDAYQNLATIYAEQQEYIKAIDALEKLLSIIEDRPAKDEERHLNQVNYVQSQIDEYRKKLANN